MIALLQRVTQASVEIADEEVGVICNGLMVLIGVEKNDDQARADRLLQRLLGYRVFADDEGRMNLNVQDVNGGLLLVPQFTLAADTQKGMRPSFSSAAPPEQGEALFNYFVTQARNQHPIVETGRFGVDMKVALINDGPATFTLRVS